MGEQPKGRGHLLELLKKHKESGKVGISEPEKSPPKSRGRAALLQKIQEQKMKEKQVGVAAGPSGEPEKPLAMARTSAEPAQRGPVETLSHHVSELSIASSEPCHYRGEAGEPLRVAANYIRLTVEKDRGVFEYEVRFVPDIDARSNRIKLVNQALGELSTTKVYDGDACLYLPSQYFTSRKEFTSVIPNTEDPVKTIIVYKRKRKMHECLHLYNVLFKRIMHILLYTQMGRNYFNTNHKIMVQQHKLEILPGYAVAVDEMEDGLMLCMDTQHRVIRSQSVYELIEGLQAADPRNFRQALTEHLLGACVLTTYNNQTYIVHDIEFTATPKDTFEARGGVPCSYIDYYKKQYNITIQDIDQPLLVHHKTKSINGVKQTFLICLIPELCNLTGLSDAMRSDFKLMKDVAVHTRITPNQRKLSMRTYLENVRKSETAQKVLSNWGLKLADGLVDLKARVLPPETIYFGGRTPDENRYQGGTDWNKAVFDNHITGPVDLINWLVFYTRRDERNGHNFAETMVRLGKGMGCLIRPPQLILLPDDRTETYMRIIKDYVTQDIQAVVFICPTLRADRYSIIKKMLCTLIPVASQVVLSKTLGNPQKVRTIIHKIALQIECKLGGTLWNLRIPVSGWMVCGIDVYHAKNQKSVCGFVCSLNSSMTRWFSEALFQEQEIGDFYKISFKKAVQHYRVISGNIPQKLIIIRDGVGDGQLDHVRKHELPQFEQVIREMGIETTVTFVVVQKRINTRVFKAIDERSSENPPAGTIVDHTITRRNLYDFFLVPQSVRQGTVNPTHYIVLHDAANIKPDHLQRLMYKLCHLYYNWCGTIRVPAPCQYAHKLAQLVGMYIKKTPSSELNDKLYYL